MLPLVMPCDPVVVKAAYGVVHFGSICSVAHPSTQTCSSLGTGLHAAPGLTALAKHYDPEGGFQPQKAGDAGAVCCSAAQCSCRVLRCHFPIWKTEAMALTHLVSYALQISM